MKTPIFLIKFLRFEYWSSSIFYFPLIPYFFFLALKHRSITFFSATNPALAWGGLMNYSKFDAIKLIEEKYLPKTILIDLGTKLAEIQDKIIEQNIIFPLIIKPNIGERGKGVCKVDNIQELQNYLEYNQTEDLIIQEFIDYPLEFGVFYYKFPDENTANVFSVTGKSFLSVCGDGKNTIDTLLQEQTHARFQMRRLREEMPEKLKIILASGEIQIIEHIGNHCRGTTFVNCNHLINKELINVFNEISKPLQGIYYGRFDLKVNSLEDLYAGENIKIMELNGVNSEPTHIYEPNYGLFRAYQDVVFCWKTISKISLQNQKKGVPLASSKAFLKMLKQRFS